VKNSAVKPIDPPLKGIRVLDLTRVIAGPFCTMMLADMGADVIKLEEPERGDELRWVGRYPGRADHDEDYFNASNRSKRGIALNLKNDDDRAIAQRLADKADVVVENFSPGVAARLGLGWDELSSRNRKMIYCSISGFGQTGPYRNRLALDPIIQAASGVMSVTGQPGQDPMQVGAPIADVTAGMFAAYAIAVSLHSRAANGQGRYIDVSMLEAMVAVLGPRMGEALQAHRSPGRFGNQNPMRVPADAYKAKDGVYIDVIVQNDNHWRAFCTAVDRPAWFEEQRYATMAGRLAHRDELNELVRLRFLERPSADWLDGLDRNRVPYAVVNDYQAVLADPQIAFRGVIRSVDHPRSGPICVVGAPWKLSDVDVAPKPPPLLGQHTDEVLQEWLGLSRA
jgi:crotonobetainyl-CoA:carnitine CoA-transferase CaiB-like acyl-CoA transferase